MLITCSILNECLTLSTITLYFALPIYLFITLHITVFITLCIYHYYSTIISPFLHLFIYPTLSILSYLFITPICLSLLVHYRFIALCITLSIYCTIYKSIYAFNYIFIILHYIVPNNTPCIILSTQHYRIRHLFLTTCLTPM